MPLSVHLEPTATWRALRAELRRAVGDSTYEIWLEPLEFVGVHNTNLVISAPAATRTWVSERFGRVLDTCARRVFGDDVRLELTSSDRDLAGQPASPTRGGGGSCGGGGNWEGGGTATWGPSGAGSSRHGGAGNPEYGSGGRAGQGGGGEPGPSRGGKSRHGGGELTWGRFGETQEARHTGPTREVRHTRGTGQTRGTPEAREVLQLDAGALNPRYSFDQFIIGDGNRLAHAAALAVAELPGQAYNPLFLHAPPGLGKTHLLHAIGNYVQAYGGGAQVRYTTVEAFTNHFIHAIGSRSVDHFKRVYRDADVLLIDDVQFLASKAKTEEEFFHTFNAVYETGRQLVLTCDRLPRQLVSVEERLRERFESGLVAVIKPPDFITRVAILRKRAALDRIHIDDQAVLELIAERITDNVRALEGALIRVVAHHSLTQRPIDVALAMAVLDEIHPRQGPDPLSLRAIQQAVASYYGITEADLKSPSRAARVSWPRQVAIHLARELTDAPLTAIGEVFGGRNHATVLHACKRVEQRASSDQQLVDELAQIRATLHPRQ